MTPRTAGERTMAIVAAIFVLAVWTAHGWSISGRLAVTALIYGYMAIVWGVGR